LSRAISWRARLGAMNHFRREIRVLVKIGGWVAVAWAALILLARVTGATSGPWVPLAGAAFVFLAYGALLLQRDRRAIPFSWVLVVLFGIAVAMSGFVPLLIILWAGLLAFTLYIHRHPVAFQP